MLVTSSSLSQRLYNVVTSFIIPQISILPLVKHKRSLLAFLVEILVSEAPGCGWSGGRPARFQDPFLEVVVVGRLLQLVGRVHHDVHVVLVVAVQVILLPPVVGAAEGDRVLSAHLLLAALRESHDGDDEQNEDEDTHSAADDVRQILLQH